MTPEQEQAVSDWMSQRSESIPHLYPATKLKLTHQSRTDSLMEAVTNTAIGFLVSLLTWIVVAHVYGIPMTWGTNLSITGIFTVVSVLRQYVLRRLFNGRSVWAAIRARWTD